MNFDFSDEQREIKSTAREFMASRFKPEKVRELAESDNPYDDALWKEMCELGWPGIAIAEENGGQGLGVLELVILQEEMGYALAPSPFVSNAVAGLVVHHLGQFVQRALLGEELPRRAAQQFLLLGEREVHWIPS